MTTAVDTAITITTYDTAIAEYAAALADADAARAALETARRWMEHLEAAYIMGGLAGKNEQERKAALLQHLARDPDYAEAEQDAATATAALREAERTAKVAYERCRLCRSALALRAAGQ